MKVTSHKNDYNPNYGRKANYLDGNKNRYFKKKEKRIVKTRLR